LSADAADIQDSPAPARNHSLQRMLRSEEGSSQVYRDDLLPPLEFEFVGEAGRGETGIVHKDVDRTMLPVDLREKSLDLRFIGDIAADCGGGRSDLACGGLEPGLVAGRENNGSALLGKPMCDGLANPAAATCDDRYFPVEFSQESILPALRAASGSDGNRTERLF